MTFIIVLSFVALLQNGVLGQTGSGSGSGSPLTFRSDHSLTYTDPVTGVSLVGSRTPDGNFILSGAYSDPTGQSPEMNYICAEGSIDKNGAIAVHAETDNRAYRTTGQYRMDYMSESSSSMDHSGVVLMSATKDVGPTKVPRFCGTYQKSFSSYETSPGSGNREESHSFNYNCNGKVYGYNMFVSGGKYETSGSGGSSYSSMTLHKNTGYVSVSGCMSRVDFNQKDNRFVAEGVAGGAEFSVQGRFAAGMFISDNFEIIGNNEISLVGQCHRYNSGTPDTDQIGSYSLMCSNREGQSCGYFSGEIYKNNTFASTSSYYNPTSGTIDFESGKWEGKGVASNRNVRANGRCLNGCMYGQSFEIKCQTVKEMIASSTESNPYGDSGRACGTIKNSRTFKAAGFVKSEDGNLSKFKARGVIVKSKPSSDPTGECNISIKKVKLQLTDSSGKRTTQSPEVVIQSCSYNYLYGSVKLSDGSVASFNGNYFQDTFGLDSITLQTSTSPAPPVVSPFTGTAAVGRK